MNLDFNKMNGVIMAVVQHYRTKVVLMVGVMTPEAIEMTVTTSRVTFWSRKRQKLWTKGETSGHFLRVVEILVDCDADTLLIMADPIGPTCHNNVESCFDQKEANQMKRILTPEMWETDKSFSLLLLDGSMNQKSMDLSWRAGYRICMPNSRSNMGYCDDPAISRVSLQRPRDIYRLVAENQFDMGIMGQDWYKELGGNLIELGTLRMSRQARKPSRISLVVSKESGYKSLSDLPLKCTIYTEYVGLTEKYLVENKRSDIEILISDGNTEDKIQLFGAAAIVELVETGNSLIANNLLEFDVLMETEMIIFTNQKAYANTYKRAKMECYVRSLQGALRAEDFVRLEANVLAESVEKAAAIIGGLKGATQCPLVKPGWYALISVVPVEDQNRIIAELLQIGVTDICRSEMPLIMI